jgi:hypothetical protein
VEEVVLAAETWEFIMEEGHVLSFAGVEKGSWIPSTGQIVA